MIGVLLIWRWVEVGFWEWESHLTDKENDGDATTTTNAKTTTTAAAASLPPTPRRTSGTSRLTTKTRKNNHIL